MTQQEQKKKKLSAKRRNGFVAGLLVILILMTGTFAWQSMQQMAFNPMWRQGNLGGRIHDRFEITDEPIRDLTIFAENFGQEDLFLRIRLREFFAINETEFGVGTAHRDRPETWPIYLAEPESAMIRREDTYTYDIGDAGVVWTMGQRENFVFMPTFNHAIYPATAVATNVPGRYNFPNTHRMTEATGNAVDWFTYTGGSSEIPETTTPEVTVPTTVPQTTEPQGTGPEETTPQTWPNNELPGENRFNHVSDILRLGRQTGPGLNTDTHQALDDGSRDNWEIGDYLVSRYIYTEVSTVGLRTVVDLNLGDERTHRAQHNIMPSIAGEGLPTGFNTATFNGILTIEQWNEWDRPTGNFWIMDTTNEEGWFYWNGYLLAEQGQRVNATSLLLAAIDLSEIRVDWEYVVVVEGEFFIDESLDYITPAISEYAMEIFRQPDLSRDIIITVDAQGNITIYPEDIEVEILEDPYGGIHIHLLDGTEYDRFTFDFYEEGWTYNITEDFRGYITIVIHGPTQLLITPSDVTLAPDEIEHFFAQTRAGVEIEDRYLIWALEGNTSDETTIGQGGDGVLTVGPDEDDGEFILRATHMDYGWTGYTTITIESEEPVDLIFPNAAIGCNQTDPAGTGNARNVFVDNSGFQWCVVNSYIYENEYEEEYEYLMLVSRYTLQMANVGGATSNQVHNEDIHVRWPATTEAALPPLTGTH